jgi:hypothetical protein
MNTVCVGRAFSDPSGDPVHTRFHATEITHEDEEFFLAILSAEQAPTATSHTAHHDQCAERCFPHGTSSNAFNATPVHEQGRGISH